MNSWLFTAGLWIHGALIGAGVVFMVLKPTQPVTIIFGVDDQDSRASAYFVMPGHLSPKEIVAEMDRLSKESGIKQHAIGAFHVQRPTEMISGFELVRP